MFAKLRLNARKPSGGKASSSPSHSAISQSESYDPGSSSSSLAQVLEAAPAPDEAYEPVAEGARVGTPDLAQSASATAFPSEPPPASPGPSLIKKGRRKSYGGLKSILGKTRPELGTPPVPSLSGQYPQAAATLPSPSRCRPSNPRPIPIPGSATAGRSREELIPASPTVTADSRPSTSSLRPFPFLHKRRKSSNPSNVEQSKLHGRHFSREQQPTTPASPGFGWGAKASHRLYSYTASKRAQSVDDLSQFGLLPSRTPTGPRRSAEYERNPQPPPGDLHRSLDKIGELAGTLAKVRVRGGKANEDRTPRLSNPKGMRTVYGVSLQDLYWRDGDEYPLLINALVGLIEEYGVDQQGLYRVPGEKKVIEELQAAIDERGVRNVDAWKAVYRDVHNLAGALKLFLREVPGGVIPFAKYQDFIALSAPEYDHHRTYHLRKLIRGLPVPNRVLIYRLVMHFTTIVRHVEHNSMQAHNLAIVFAPSILRLGNEQDNPLLAMQNIGKASTILRHMIVEAGPIFSATSPTTSIVSIGSSLDEGSSGVLTSTEGSMVSALTGTPALVTTSPDGTSADGAGEDVEKLNSPVGSRDDGFEEAEEDISRALGKRDSVATAKASRR